MIWQNLIFGVCFILVGEVAIIFGLVGPMLAAGLHTFASAIVVFNSARMVRYGEHIASHVSRPREAPASPVPGRVALQPVG